MKKLVILASALALTATASFAEGDNERKKAKKEITQSEFMAKKAEWFQKLDANGDGKLSAEERKAGREMRKEHRADKKEARQEKREERKEKRAERKESRVSE